MRAALQFVICVIASLPVWAWEAPLQNEMAALQGVEPFAEGVEYGIPLPPTAAEARMQSGYRYELERAALKQVLVYRTSRAKADRNRMTPANNATCAKLARQLGAPGILATYLDLLADSSLSRRQQYVVEQLLRRLVQETYGIDTLQMRLVSESAELPPAQHMRFMLQLPVSSMFDLVPAKLPPKQRVLSDIMLMTSILRQVDGILSRVQNASGADAAAQALQALLPMWETTLQTRYHASRLSADLTPAERMSARLLESTQAGLLRTRRRLHENDWYQSTRLRTIDELFRRNPAPAAD